MRLYITTWKTAEDKTEYEFTGTQSDQRRVKKVAEAEGSTVVRNEEVEVPTVKEPLIAFLNTFRVVP